MVQLTVRNRDGAETGRTGVVHLVGGDKRGAADGREQGVRITGRN